jgi:hypothetical protein
MLTCPPFPRGLLVAPEVVLSEISEKFLPLAAAKSLVRPKTKMKIGREADVEFGKRHCSRLQSVPLTFKSPIKCRIVN